MLVRLRFAAPFAASLFVLLAACVGDDPAPSSGSSSSSGGTPDAASSGGEGGGPGTCTGDTIEACGDACTPCAAPTDGHAECKNRQCQMVCDSGKTLCGDACVVTATSGDHCGKCDHSCGGGQCDTGVCQPIVVASGLTNTHAIDVSPTDGVIISADQNIVRCDVPGGCTANTLKAVATGFSGLSEVVESGTELYFVSTFGDYSRIAKCPMPAGCPAPAAIDANIVENIVNRNHTALVVGPSLLAWAVRSFNGSYIEKCTLPGCTAIGTVRAEQTSATLTNSDTSNPVNGLAASSTRVLYGSGVYGVGGVGVRSCAYPTCNTTPTDITGGGGTLALTFFNGKFYVAMAGGSSSSVWSVDDGTTTLKAVGSDLAGITDIAADGTGIYWTNGTTGKINKCDLAGCAGGTPIATGQTGASRIRVDSQYVYWMTPTSVLKIVKN